ncbi:MAG: polyisoprenoid-binding protein [Phycisphaerae bacterium]|jgi:polyisoprenoid-binding protein YceI|nr:polyisoprenoid-binding protein [Phycisphaerae bacterium]
MSIRATTALLLLALAPLAMASKSNIAAKETFNIDSVHSTAIFRVQHLGAGNFYGRFNELEGTIDWDAEDGPSFDVSIKIESVDSGNEALDKHLKNADFFDAKQFPTMTFKSTGAKKMGDNWKVTGEMTMHGVTKPVEVDMEFVGRADVGRGDRVGFETTFTIKRSDFGMNWGVENGALGDTTKIIVSLEGIKAG